MPRPVSQLIGVAGKVAKAGAYTVVDYTGPVQIYDSSWRTDPDVKFVLLPSAKAPVMALFAAAIGKTLELSGSFLQDDPPGTTVRADSVINVIVG